MAQKVSVKQREYVLEQARNAMEKKKASLLKEKGHTAIEFAFRDKNSGYEHNRYRDAVAKELIESNKFEMRQVTKSTIIQRVKGTYGLCHLSVYDITDLSKRVIVQMRINDRIETAIQKVMDKLQKKFHDLHRTAMLSGAEEIAKALADFEKAAK
jgi:RNA polymerase-binding transcription factor DksA